MYGKLNELAILNVGCNDATQMEKLIGRNFKELYLVDIGIRSLQLAKKSFPDSKVLYTNADDLSDIADNSIDLYLSFRTYNSSFFNIEGSISELNRVLSDNGAAILSIPNGYVDSDGNFSHGLKPHSKDYVDEAYPFEITGFIVYYLSKCDFKNICILNSFYEIYIYITR
ncbi:methyltransferase domain-containing protein [uncultured Methanobrevibacter sp.]|uniref:methyltransferase domain-containing protein n=1 Tax=uncultured Methanobrevibacter sp. TaxID=253161 RepID=UPI0025D5302F|nr:methyltransferase domain-containing protein [uncultured Methanobrevibacter sp.]